MLQMVETIEGNEEIEVVRVKNRMTREYDVRMTGSYRDININMRIVTPLSKYLGVSGHVCELELILDDFMQHKTLDGHSRYVKFRNMRCE